VHRRGLVVQLDGHDRGAAGAPLDLLDRADVDAGDADRRALDEESLRARDLDLDLAAAGTRQVERQAAAVGEGVTRSPPDA
jgi:hypothetical protein